MTKALISIAFVACAFAAGDPFLGTWKCNFEKSRTNVPNPPPRPRSMTLRYELHEGGGFRMTGEAIMEDGKKRSTERIVVFDGLEKPRTPDAPAGDTVINRRIDRNTEEMVYKLDGKVYKTITRVVSQDGKILTYTTKSVSPDGKADETVIVYEKQ